MKSARLYIAVCMCAVLQACHDDSYGGRGEEFMGTDGKIPVMVAIGDPSGNITRGTGSIDDPGSLAGRQVYVYAFSRDSRADYSRTSAQDRDMCLVDGSVDTPAGAFHGKAAEVGSIDSYVTWKKEDPALCWPSGSKYTRAYDFFAYYLDDAVPSQVLRTDDHVSLSLRIDGSQDIMRAKAEIGTGQLAGFPEDEKLRISSYSFSYYTAQRSIVPVFRMSHELVKLNFEVSPGVTQGESKEVIVTAVKVRSRDKAEFVVAHKDKGRLGLEFSDSMEKLPLTEAGGAPFNPEGYAFVTRHDSSVPVQRQRIGGSLLVAPDAGYTAYITMVEKMKDGTVVENENEIDILFADGFVAGSQYNVTLTVLGYMNVYMEVTLEKWDDGGDVTLDPDTNT